VILHISHFSSSDEGNYTCETVSNEGTEIFHFDVKGIQMQTFEAGKDASLRCTNITVDELIMEVWRVKRRDGDDCRVSWQFGNHETNSTCDSRVTIQQEEDRVILHISHFSSSDEGNYTCKTVSSEGTEIFHFNVKASFTASSRYNIFTDENMYHCFIILLSFAGSIAMTFLIFSIMRMKQQAQIRKHEERESTPCDQ
ncbi:hypothetical protein AAFF_G00134270, partial [Aldrovandia affinis]